MNSAENKRKYDSYTKVAGKMRLGFYWLNKEEYKNTTIGKKNRLARETVRDIVKTIEETNTSLPRKFIGRPKNINPRGLRQFKRAIVCNPFMSIQQATKELKHININVCRGTIVFYLRDLEFEWYYAAYKPASTDTHKRNRLQRTKEHS